MHSRQIVQHTTFLPNSCVNVFLMRSGHREEMFCPHSKEPHLDEFVVCGYRPIVCLVVASFARLWLFSNGREKKKLERNVAPDVFELHNEVH